MNDLSILYSLKYLMNFENNNWRKLHGYPMLRTRKRNRKLLFKLPRIDNPTLCVVGDTELINKFYTSKEK